MEFPIEVNGLSVSCGVFEMPSGTWIATYQKDDGSGEVVVTESALTEKEANMLLRKAVKEYVNAM